MLPRWATGKGRFPAICQPSATQCPVMKERHSGFQFCTKNRRFPTTPAAQDVTYDERSRQIAPEMLYLMSQVATTK